MKLHISPEQQQTIEEFTSPHTRADEWENLNLGDKDGSLLYHGAAGTGKSTIAAQILHKVSGIPLSVVKTKLTLDFSEILSNQLGVTEKLSSDFFKKEVYPLQKKYNSPVPIALFDECEAIMFDRSMVGQGNTYMFSIITHVLKLVDDFKSKGGVFLATTNYADKLDKAFYSRFDQVVKMPALSPSQSLPFWMLNMPDAPFGISEGKLTDALHKLTSTTEITPRFIANQIKTEKKRAFAKRETMQISNLLNQL